MTTVAKLFKNTQVLGDAALEIELEGQNLPTRDSSGYWKVVEDGSLKGGLEYVMRVPGNLQYVEDSLDVLLNLLKKSKVNDGYRAGIHCHINCQELTMRQLVNFICCYALVEDYLIDWCDPRRKGNHFCLKIKDAEFLPYTISKFIRTGDIKHIQTDNIRYSAINLLSLFKFGSLEFRALESTCDKAKILKWANVLLNIKNNSKMINNPIDILDIVKDIGANELSKQLLGNSYKDFVKNYEPEEVEESVDIIKDIVYSRSWGIDLNIFNKTSNIF